LVQNLADIFITDSFSILRKKGTKAVTGAVPFQKSKLLSISGAKMYILSVNMCILGVNMYI